jgi:flagellar basal-body rod protein FlgF
MDRLIYLAMAGAKATMQRQETLANNLANASTGGFRAELAAFRAVPVEGSGASTRVYALESTAGYDASPGQVAATGRNLDVAMRGAAWLALQARDGSEAYTRGGSLDIDAQGTLVTASGLTVLGDGGPIQVPRDTHVAIAADGTVSAIDAQGRSSSIGRLKLVTPEAPLVRGSDGLFRGSDGDLAADSTARLQDGALEGSNVSTIETMVQMIAAARQFEAQMRSLTTAEGNDKAASQLLSVG